MAEGAPQAIIIKKVKKGGHGAHHGGAWKIAYADFVTAMMAFFLLLWLLNSVTQESLEGISNYFAPVSVSQSTSGSDGVLGGKSLSTDGAGTSSSGQVSVTMDLPPPRAGTGGDAQETPEEISEQAAKEALEAIEQEQFDQAQQVIEEALEESEDLQQLKRHLMIDDTPEGLRIQIVDQDGQAMFASGGASMFERTEKLMALVSKVILSMPQKISIVGHTDAVPFSNSRGYSNWELSSDRANAARRELVNHGVPYERVSRVIGKAATEPLLVENPKHASNRRLTITMMRGTGGPAEAVEDVLPGLSEIKQKQFELKQQEKNGNGNDGNSTGLDLQPIVTQPSGN